jgi:hypothetical protein
MQYLNYNITYYYSLTKWSEGLQKITEQQTMDKLSIEQIPQTWPKEKPA